MTPTTDMPLWFYRLPARIIALSDSAHRWEGTPWRANACVRGEGASCHLAVASVLQESGLDLPPVPNGHPGWARHNTRSIMEEWLDAHPERFLSVATGATLFPGDVVGFKVGLCIHHLGVILSNGRFFQCIEATGAVIMSQAEREFRQRMARVWRPLESKT